MSCHRLNFSTIILPLTTSMSSLFRVYLVTRISRSLFNYRFFYMKTELSRNVYLPSYFSCVCCYTIDVERSKTTAAVKIVGSWLLTSVSPASVAFEPSCSSQSGSSGWQLYTCNRPATCWRYIVAVYASNPSVYSSPLTRQLTRYYYSLMSFDNRYPHRLHACLPAEVTVNTRWSAMRVCDYCRENATVESSQVFVQSTGWGAQFGSRTPGGASPSVLIHYSVEYRSIVSGVTATMAAIVAAIVEYWHIRYSWMTTRVMTRHVFVLCVIGSGNSVAVLSCISIRLWWRLSKKIFCLD